jgi:hypothetical protein
MNRNALALLATLVLTGCAAPTVTAAPTAALPATGLPPHAGSADPIVVRHLLENSDGQAKLWGLRYTSTTESFARANNNKCYGSNAGYHWEYDGVSNWCVQSFGWNVDWSRTGAGQFETIGHHASAAYSERFTFTVPEDQVLVINELGGSLAINGFDVGSAQREKVDYLFGSGEVVIFSCGPGAWAAGFTADPALLGAGAKSARSAK